MLIKKQKGGDGLNLEKLQQAISASGITYTFIADALGISRQQLSKKINGEVEFKVSEANKLCTILRLDRSEKEDIFFS